jgi:flavin reductase (DIM6/NTAB) family NADH-FMN oxidoreductase RutF
MTVDANILRHTMRRWATGVTVVTTQAGEEQAGMTVSSFTSVSLEPPTVLVCLNKDTYTHTLVQKSGVFAISMLAAGQEMLSNRFAGLDPLSNDDRFKGVELAFGETKSPLLMNALAWLDCVVRSTADTTTHTIFIGEVVFARYNPDAAPLIYHDRGYHVLTAVEQPQS